VLATVSFAAADLPESAALAAGYAQAFEAARKSSVSISYLGDTQTETIRAHSVSAHGGVLLVRFRGGAGQILDPARIVKMTFD